MIVTKQQKEKRTIRHTPHHYIHTPLEPLTQPQTADYTTTWASKPEKWLAVGAISILLLGLIWWAREPLTTFMTLLGNQTAVSAHLKSYGLLGPIVLALAQLLQVLVAIIPGHVFLIAAGYVYGFPLGFLLNITYVVAASQIGFLIARRAGRPIINRLASPALVDKWQKIAEERGVLFFTIAFVLPVFPTDVMNFVAGLTGMSPRKFLIANFLGRVPSAIMLTLVGSHGLRLSTSAWATLGIIVVIIYGAGRVVMNHIEKRYTA